jgi:hypothetical protein
MPSPFGTKARQLRLSFAMAKLLQETHNFIFSLIFIFKQWSSLHTHTQNWLGSRLSWKLTWKFRNSLATWGFKILARE